MHTCSRDDQRTALDLSDSLDHTSERSTTSPNMWHIRPLLLHGDRESEAAPHLSHLPRLALRDGHGLHVPRLFRGASGTVTEKGLDGGAHARVRHDVRGRQQMFCSVAVPLTARELLARAI